MKIGSLDLGYKLLVAPMAEVSDSAFRKISKKHGAGLTFTQMVSAEGILKNNFESLRLFSFGRDEKPIGVQLLGKDPAIIGEAVSELRKYKPDLIDLNCGCPMEKVTSKGMGSSISDNPQLLAAIVKSMVQNSGDVPISVKLRLGKDQLSINIKDSIKIVEDNGASLVIVHARTAGDSYKTDAQWNWLKEIKKLVSIPVVGNGSCFQPVDAKNLIEETGCDSVMIARGALGNPFYFSRFNTIMNGNEDPGEPLVEEVAATAAEHCSMLVTEFGEINALEKAKKHTVWYFKNYPGISSLLDNIFKLKSVSELKELILTHENEIKSGKLKQESISDIGSRFKNKVLFWLSK